MYSIILRYCNALSCLGKYVNVYWFTLIHLGVLQINCCVLHHYNALSFVGKLIDIYCVTLMYLVAKAYL